MTNKEGLTRRSLLRGAVATGALALTGAGFICAPDAAWAMEVKSITPQQMTTLLQMARDIYPHDQVPDQYYAVAVKGYDADDKKAAIEKGIAEVDAAAKALGHADYVSIGWEEERVKVLQSIEKSEFFQGVRGGLVTGLYNQKEVWPIFGYEGESYSKGGYIARGFDDIAWL
jgi:hypothetical protein